MDKLIGKQKVEFSAARSNWFQKSTSFLLDKTEIEKSLYKFICFAFHLLHIFVQIIYVYLV